MKAIDDFGYEATAPFLRSPLTSLNTGQAVANIRSGGSKQAFAKTGYKTLKGGSYRGMWWVLHNAHGAFAARGVACMVKRST
jgi:hypothetical protein